MEWRTSIPGKAREVSAKLREHFDSAAPSRASERRTARGAAVAEELPHTQVRSAAATKAADAIARLVDELEAVYPDSTVVVVTGGGLGDRGGFFELAVTVRAKGEPVSSEEDAAEQVRQRMVEAERKELAQPAQPTRTKRGG
jgi:molybdopterin-biosynthesis enzyme MoeA-like protein